MPPSGRGQAQTATPDVRLWGRCTTPPAAWAAVWLSYVLLIIAPALAWSHPDWPPFPSLRQDSASPLAAVVEVPSPESFPRHNTHPGLFLAALFFLASLGLSSIRRRSRRAAALCCALVLGLSTLSMAVHAVHHLGDPAPAAKCLMFSLAHHVTGAAPATWELLVPRLVVAAPPLGTVDTPVVASCPRPDQPRAPPRRSA